MLRSDERSRKVDDPGLLALPENLRDKDVRERLKQCSELASEHASTLQVEMEAHYDKNSRQRSLAAGQRVFVLLSDGNNSLLCNWKGPYAVLRKVNDTNYEIDLAHRVTYLHINILRLWNERTDEPAVNVVVVEHDEDVEKFELPLIGDAERDSGEFIMERG